MLATIIILSILLISFFGLTVAVALIARAQYNRAQRLEMMLDEYDDVFSEFAEDVQTTYQHIKNIDDKQMFEKDDDVGTVFQDMVEIITKFNERTQAKLEK
jgi:hypothetical protein